jgi:hypothetical protein
MIKERHLMGKTFHCLLVLALAELTIIAAMSTNAKDTRPELRDWSQYPVPHGYPKTPRPRDAEFLKILPPLRTVPPFDNAERELGMALWWQDYSVHIFQEQPPAPESLGRAPRVRTTPGEDEPLVFGLWGIDDVGEVSVRVENAPFPITIRKVEFNPRRVPGENFGDRVEGGRMVGFANYLPLADTGKVEKGQNTVFWLTVETPADTKPGAYEATLRVGTGRRHDALTESIRIDVLDYVLPESDIAFGMYFRPNVDNDADYLGGRDFLPSHLRTPELMRMYWQDLKRHGMTSVTIYNNYHVNPLFDEANHSQLADDPDIRSLQEMMGMGLTRGDIPVMFLAHVPIEAAGAVVTEAKALGLPELLFYGPDEPVVGDENALNHLVSLQQLREHFRLITAISDHPARVLGKYLDVWVVSSGRIDSSMLELARECNAEIWTYDCNNKGTGNAPNSRFYAGLYTWALGLRGNFVWCYTEGYDWDRRHDAFFCHVIPTEQEPVPSIQWETRREGTKDYRTLRLLESRIAENPDSVKAKEAQAWLDGIRYHVDWYRGRGIPPAMVNWDSIELWPACGNFAPAELSTVRDRASEYILALKPADFNPQ